MRVELLSPNLCWVAQEVRVGPSLLCRICSHLWTPGELQLDEEVPRTCKPQLEPPNPPPNSSGVFSSSSLVPSLCAGYLTEDRSCLETPCGTDLCLSQDPSFLRQLPMSARTRFHLLFPFFRPCWGFSDTLSPCCAVEEDWLSQGSWQQPQHPQEAFQGFCLQPEELHTSAGVISSRCCWRAPHFGEQPHPKPILALPLEARSNSRGNPLAEPRMKSYILSMSREITSGTSVNATESL